MRTTKEYRNKNCFNKSTMETHRRYQEINLNTTTLMITDKELRKTQGLNTWEVISVKQNRCDRFMNYGN